MPVKTKEMVPWDKHLDEVHVVWRFWKVAVCGAVLLCLAGCGEGQAAADSGLKDEVAKLRQEVARLKDEVSRQKDALRDMHRRADMSERNLQREMFRSSAGTNGVARTMGRRGMPSREEMEARRKMMQDPEMRKKLEAEHKARMEERRRLHEERRREIENRRRARPAPDAAVPAK